MSLNLEKIRYDFPILREKVNNKNLVYFDNAATTQKPSVMIEALSNYYSHYNANIHRGVHTLSQRATVSYESTRDYIARVYGCKRSEVIFTKSSTESLNLLAYSLSSSILENNANIVLTDAEHHSNIVPWQLRLSLSDNTSREKLATGVRTLQGKIRFVEFDENGEINLEDLKAKIDKHTQVLSFTWASNTFGLIYPAEKIIQVAKSINPEIIIIIDAAQALPHRIFNFKELGADFITFSAHKLCGPTGVGILIGREELLEKIPPYLGGGDMIRDVSWEETIFNDLPYKFEAGTPNIADVIAFKASLEYLNNLGFDEILKQEEELVEYLLEQLKSLNFIDIYGPKDLSVLKYSKKIALVSFNVRGIHAHDIGTILDEDGIAVRTGHHCTQLIMKRLEIPASVRASLYFYNTKKEIDIMIESLKRAYIIFNN